MRKTKPSEITKQNNKQTKQEFQTKQKPLQQTLKNISSNSPYLKSQIPPLTKYVSQQSGFNSSQNKSKQQQLGKFSQEEEQIKNLKVLNKSIVNSQYPGGFFNGSSNGKQAMYNQTNIQSPHNQWIGGADTANDKGISKKNIIPPLSKWQEHIQQKYRKKSNQEQQNYQNILDESSQLQRVSQDIQNLNFNENLNKRLNRQKNRIIQKKHEYQQKSSEREEQMDSLRQSRIDNSAIQENNSWILDSQYFGLNNQQNQIESLQNNIQGFKNVQNPFKRTNKIMNKNMKIMNLAQNNLYSHKEPEFREEDDQIIEQFGTVEQDIKNNGPFFGNSQVKEIGKLNQNYSKQQQIQGKINQKQHNSKEEFNNNNRSDFKKICLQKYSYILGDSTIEGNGQQISQFFNNQQKNSQEIIIRQDVSDFPQTTSRFINVNANTYRSQTIQDNGNKEQKKKKSINNLQTKTVADRLNSSNNRSGLLGQGKELFIEKKSSSQILGAILGDQKKLKLYLKYLQVLISRKEDQKQPQQQVLSQKSQNNIQAMNVLSCILIRVQQISSSNAQKDKNQSFLKSILSMGQGQERQIDKSQSKFSPQIIHSNKGMKIQFDPFYKRQKQFLDKRIQALKKELEKKNKETELIKLSYDQIIHDYASSLQNLANKDKQKQTKSQVYSHSNQGVETKSAMFPEKGKQQEKFFIDVNQVNRGSLQFDKIHRKTTFGKAPSSMRNSNPMNRQDL